MPAAPFLAAAVDSAADGIHSIEKEKAAAAAADDDTMRNCARHWYGADCCAWMLWRNLGRWLNKRGAEVMWCGLKKHVKCWMQNAGLEYRMGKLTFVG
jgi:hypothetical protein